MVAEKLNLHLILNLSVEKKSEKEKKAIKEKEGEKGKERIFFFQICGSPSQDFTYLDSFPLQILPVKNGWVHRFSAWFF